MTEQQAQDAGRTTAEAQDADAPTDSQADGQDSQLTGFDALPKETQDEILRLRRQNATYRTKAKEYEGAAKRLQQFEDAQKTEAQRQQEALEAAETRAKTFEQRYREAQGRISVTQAANAITNVYDPDTVADLAMAHLEYDDDGKPTNVDDAIEKVRKARPRLFPAATGSGDGGRGNGDSAKPIDINDGFRQLGRMAH